MKLGAIVFTALSSLCTSVLAHSNHHIMSASVYEENGVPYSTFLTETSGPGLPTLCDPTVKSSAGYFTVDTATKKNYFYWFFESRSVPSTDPIVLWLTGGPGCSSELALLTENGPCLMETGDKEPKRNAYGWNAFANLLYVDQPAGTGFSTATSAGYDSNEAEVSEDLYHFIIDFLKGFPQFQNNDFFITGESYAGHYVPATSHRVWLGNKNKESDIKINFKGLAVGNGLTAPEIQYSYYAEMAYNFTLERVGKSVISLSAYQQMTKAIPTCISKIADCQKTTSKCSAAESYCNNAMLSPYEATGKNVYNVRLPCSVPGLCYDFSAVEKFLNLASTKQALGVSTSAKWESCNNQVNGMFANDWMKNFDNQIPDLLADGIRVLIYAGDLDFICNWIGNKAWTLALPWTGHNQFNAAKDQPWRVNGVEKGLLRSYENFSFLQVYEAGHLVPMDQPEAALQMLKEFVTGSIKQEPIILSKSNLK